VTLGIPDCVWGETVAALVVAADSVSDEELLAHCSRHLEPRKVPTQLLRVAALPRGLSGKVVTERAREMLQSKVAAAGRDLQSRSPVDQLLQIASSCFKTPRSALSLASVPRDVPGWDSLAHLEFVCALEKEFGLKLSARDIMSLDRLDKALGLVEEA